MMCPLGVSFVLGCVFFWSLPPARGALDVELERRTRRAVVDVVRRLQHGRDIDLDFNDEDDEDSKTVNTFTCPPLARSPSTPTSVNSLRPGDIKVIAALGDSLTTARGANGGLLGLLFDQKGLSWSIGGESTFRSKITLPNILRQYNPDLYGFSTSSNDNLNMAKIGATSWDIYDQAQRLVDRLKKNRHIDFRNDWKVVTIFIGANDVCHSCENTTYYTPIAFKTNLQRTLDYLQDNLPRSFVNLVELFPLEILKGLAKNAFCKVVHSIFCRCAITPESPQAESRLVEVRQGIQQAARDLATSGRYDGRPDFTVVLQPFFRDTRLPTSANGRVDWSFFASDCFHFDQKTHAGAAVALWNNMIERVGSKQTSWSPNEVLVCPSQDSPFLFTAKNS